MIRVAVVCALAVCALALPAGAAAHNVGWPIHKALCTVGIGCRDVPPRPGPQTPCPAEVEVGTVETIWDPRLGGYVEWVCTSDGWRRTGKVVPSVGLPWDPPEYRRVIDYHRACRAIVCRSIAVGHNYPSQWALGLAVFASAGLEGRP